MMPWDAQRLWSASADGAAAGGGADDLQTDVMRFMAMLALCLVAIFALVQSLPLTPVDTVANADVELISVPPAPVAVTPPPTATVEVVDDALRVRRSVAAEAASPVEAPAAAEKAMAGDKPTALEKTVTVEPVPHSSPSAAMDKSIARASPASAPMVTEAQAAAVPARPTGSAALRTPPEQVGFTLRFQSDEALLKLVSEERVHLYALDSTASLVLRKRPTALVFEPATPPRQLHEMELSSVPDSVRVRYARASGRSAASDNTFGVVLPPSMLREINGLVSGRRGGELRIAGDGSVSLQ
jgi:hypothetical protein